MANVREKVTVNGIEIVPPEFDCEKCGCTGLVFRWVETNRSIQMRCAGCGAWFGNYRYTTPETAVMPFGKHKGEKLADLPVEYLEWLYYKCDGLNDSLYDTVEEILEEKKAEK